MKHAFLMILSAATLMTVGAQAKQSAKESKICASLQELADQDCVSIMCDDSIADGTFKDEGDCTSAPDYAEAAQGACEDTLLNRVKEYNAQHSTHVKCEE